MSLPVSQVGCALLVLSALLACSRPEGVAKEAKSAEQRANSAPSTPTTQLPANSLGAVAANSNVAPPLTSNEAAPASSSAESVAPAPTSERPSASALASWPEGGAPSPVPTTAEWATAPMVPVEHGYSLGCEAKRVREWLRLSCRTTSVATTQVTGIEVKRPSPKPSDVFEFAKAGVGSVVLPVRRGSDYEVELRWQAFSRTFHVNFPELANGGGALPNLRFDAPAPAGAGVSPVEQAGKAKEEFEKLRTQRAQAKLEGPALSKGSNAPAPSEETWKSAKRLALAGGAALGCEATQLPGWVRVVCSGRSFFGKHATHAAIHTLGGSESTQNQVVTVTLPVLDDGASSAYVVWHPDIFRLLIEGGSKNPRASFVGAPAEPAAGVIRRRCRCPPRIGADGLANYGCPGQADESSGGWSASCGRHEACGAFVECQTMEPASSKSCNSDEIFAGVANFTSCHKPCGGNFPSCPKGFKCEKTRDNSMNYNGPLGCVEE